MTTKDLTLLAHLRVERGKKVRKLRREGIMPGVVYGPAIAEPHGIQFDSKAFETLYQSAGKTTLIRLQLGAVSQQWRVFIRSVQYNALKRKIEHVDFYAANLLEETTVVVPIHIVGEAPVVALGTGMLEQVHHTVSVRALPTNVPSHLDADISTLATLVDSIRVSDLQLPPGVTIIDAADTVLITATRTGMAEAEEEAAAVSEPVPAETTPGESESDEASQPE